MLIDDNLSGPSSRFKPFDTCADQRRTGPHIGGTTDRVGLTHELDHGGSEPLTSGDYLGAWRIEIIGGRIPESIEIVLLNRAPEFSTPFTHLGATGLLVTSAAASCHRHGENDPDDRGAHQHPGTFAAVGSVTTRIGCIADHPD